MKAIRYVGACILAFAVIPLCNAEDLDIKNLQAEIYETIEQVRPAVVSISRGGSAFSGVIVSKTGHVLSAAHAVQPGADYRILLPDGRRFRGKGKGSNPQADCALIQIVDLKDKEIPFVQMGESATLVANQPVLSLAFPGGQGTRSGPLVRFGRYLRGSRSSRPTLQSTALMEPGDSGGPLFDLDGRVIGIHSRINTNMTRNYEVPIDVFVEYWNELNADRVFTQRGVPPLPKLGIRYEPEDGAAGLRIIQVVPRSIAAAAKLKPKDVLKSVHGKEVPDLKSLQAAIETARDDGSEEIELVVKRGDEEVTLKAPFKVQREPAPEAPFPEYDKIDLTEPTGYKQLATLSRQFSELESELDDCCVSISSQLPTGKSQKIVGTLIEGTDLLISKNSMVAEKPVAANGEEELELEVVERDPVNDLVLLRLPQENESGIQLENEADEGPLVGRFLLTPDARGSGMVSVWSTVVFESKKQRSIGFLGVVPKTHEKDQGAYLDRVDNGAAKRAGLKVGDVIKKMGDKEIKTHDDLRAFLRKLEANMTVVATILRGREELKKTITLGVVPPTRHAADMMNKSFRRDGFAKSHFSRRGSAA